MHDLEHIVALLLMSCWFLDNMITLSEPFFLNLAKVSIFFLYVFLFVICYDYTRDSICNILRVNILRLIKTELLLRRPEVYRSKMLNLQVVGAWFKIPLLENGLLLYGRKNNFSSILLGFWLQAPPDVIKYIIKREKQIEV